MKIKKYKIAILSLIVTIMAAVGCVRMDYNPYSQISEDSYWLNLKDAKSGLVGVYSSWGNVYGYLWLSDGWADHCLDWGVQGNTIYENIYTKSKRNVALGNHGMGVFDDNWNLNYTCIQRANQAIENMGRVPVKNNEEKAEIDIMIAECRLMRAACYFQLLDLFGSVPYFDRKITNEEAFVMSKMPREELKAKIIADMDIAVSTLPYKNKIAAGDYGRFSKGAALALRGKINLYWASWQERDVTKKIAGEGSLSDATIHYKAAAADFAAVMKPEHGYKLFTGDFGDLFTPSNEQCDEIVMTVEYAGPSLGLGEFKSANATGTRSILNSANHFWVLSEAWNVFQDRTTGENESPVTFGDGKGALDIANANAFDNRDLRMASTLILQGSKMYRVDNGAVKELLTFDLFKPGAGAADPIYYGQNSTTYLSLRKGVCQWPNQLLRNDGQMDIYIIRYADVILMYAEAMNKGYGPTQDVYDNINVIRARGGLPMLNQDKYNTVDMVHKAIMQERAAELMSEGTRFFDIRRWGVVEDIFGNNKAHVYKPHNNSNMALKSVDRFLNATSREYQRYYLQNIPLAEISRNPNLLPQNSEW